MKKLLRSLIWLALGILIGSALEAIIGEWLATAILWVVLCVALWNIIKEEV